MTQKFTDYQLAFAEQYGLNPALCPAEEPTDPGNTNPSGFRRQAPLRFVEPPLTELEQKQRLAGIYGLRASNITLPSQEDTVNE